jgi:hypothetical protein
MPSLMLSRMLVRMGSVRLGRFLLVLFAATFFLTAILHLVRCISGAGGESDRGEGGKHLEFHAFSSD